MWGTDGTLFVVSGNAVLQKDIPADLVGQNTTIINITSESVTLDGDNKAIYGNTNTQYGVHVPEAKTVTIKDFTVDGTFKVTSGNVYGIFAETKDDTSAGTIQITGCTINGTIQGNGGETQGIGVNGNVTSILIQNCKITSDAEISSS